MTVYLNDLGLASAIGSGKAETARRLFRGEAPGMRDSDAYAMAALPCGQVEATLPPLLSADPVYASRNNRLLQLVMEQLDPPLPALLDRHGAGRVAAVLGTSTSGIAEGEQALAELARGGKLPAHYRYEQQELGSPADYLREQAGVAGPCYVISTACSSSAHALASAARLLRAGIADCVLAGGVDTLCRFTIGGFGTLNSVSARRCNPLSRNRDGITIGEAAALFVLTREPAPVRLAGWGASADASHMSAPHPQGAGAMLAIEAALLGAGLDAAAIEYVNLHGTATPQNDLVEAQVVAQRFGSQVPVSSTKPLTGHTLGAAGALEAALVWLTVHPDNARGQLPPQLWDQAVDPQLPPLNVVGAGTALGHPPAAALSNSFAFGGNNAALILAGA